MEDGAAIGNSHQPSAISHGDAEHIRAAPPRPNVLLVTIDTFRADRVGIGLTPAIDRLAASGLRFTAARTAVPLTLPSHTTILTGLLPPAHGVRENGIDALDATHPTIARLLKGAGYDTAAFVGAFVLDHRFGLAQGFDTYDDQIPRDPDATERLEAERPASAVVDRALAWLGAHKAAVEAASSSDRQAPAPSPQPHSSCGSTSTILTRRTTPPKEFLAARAARRTTARSRTPTRSSRACSTRCARRRLIDHTMVVVAGDHGEGLGDHGERDARHAALRLDAARAAGHRGAGRDRRRRRRDEPVSLADLAPTILARRRRRRRRRTMKGRDLLDGAGCVRVARCRRISTARPSIRAWPAGARCRR